MASLAEGLRPASLSAYLKHSSERDLLRFSTAGSVDDGKSTLIGRLLFDAGGAFDDQIEAVKSSKINRAGAGHVDFSLLTDGLNAEREQGITIDVAYRYFSTPKRKFIIADTPGHEEYTRNMATGASTCDAAVVLVDVRQGLTEQSRRHARIAWLLGIPNAIVAVNKMDLVDYSEEAFARVRDAFAEMASGFEGLRLSYIPVSALFGDNVVQTSSKTPWYTGRSLLEMLEELPAVFSEHAAFRFPVQRVNRPSADFRGYAGQIASGRVQPGDRLTALPSGREVRVERIVTWDGDLDEAIAPMSVTLVLDREIDLSRGDMLTADPQPTTSRRFCAQAVALLPGGIQSGRDYLLKHSSQRLPARLVRGNLAMNGIGEVEIEATRPIYFDPYRSNRLTGAFILIDRESNNTVAAGMIEAAIDEGLAVRTEPVTAAERFGRWRHRGVVVRVDTPELANALERTVFEHGGVPAIASSEEAVSHLLEAGLLVIRIGGEGSMEGPVDSILRKLALDGVLGTDQLSLGEGI